MAALEPTLSSNAFSRLEQELQSAATFCSNLQLQLLGDHLQEILRARHTGSNTPFVRAKPEWMAR